MKSNCLFEAVKAKLKDPKNIKITFFPKELNFGFPHVIWYNKTNNTICHYINPKKHSHLLFDGKIKVISLDTFEAWVLNNLSYSHKKMLKYAKKYDFKIIKIKGVLDYATYGQDIIDNTFGGDLPSQRDIDVLKKILRTSDIQIKAIYDNQLHLLKLKEALTFENKKIFSWKYITLFDNDYRTLPNKVEFSEII